MIKTVAELVNHLSGLPPMMPVFVRDIDHKEIKVIITAYIDNQEDRVPTLQLISSVTVPEPTKIAIPYDEQIAEQKHRALAMGAESRKAREGIQ